MIEFSYTIVFVSDMTRSVAFYRDVLRQPLRFESPKWTEFETPGVTLALHLADAPSHSAASSHAIPAGQCRLGFSVEDIDAFHEEMVAKGVPCLQPPQEEDFGGRLAGYADPDGQPFWVSDSPKQS
jgi:lactoylglutathione lyase